MDCIKIWFPRDLREKIVILILTRVVQLYCVFTITDQLTTVMTSRSFRYVRSVVRISLAMK